MHTVPGSVELTAGFRELRVDHLERDPAKRRRWFGDAGRELLRELDTDRAERHTRDLRELGRVLPGLPDVWARLELPKHTRGVIGISRRQGKVRDDA